MRAGLSTIQQTLTPEAASVLNHSIAEAGRRNHSQTTPLHVAATLLASPTGYLRQACIKSHPNSSHPLQCRALELCFSVALDRLPTSQTTTASAATTTEPPISNALMAALKRAQAHQRRGCPEQQQQPLLAVKVELEQLIISILDDPSVSRVMREASFSSPAVKATIEHSINFSNTSNSNNNPTAGPNSVSPGTGLNNSVNGPIGMSFRPQGLSKNLYLNPRLQGGHGGGGVAGTAGGAANSSVNSVPGQSRLDDIKKVGDVLLREKKRNPVLVGDSELQAVVKELLKRIENNEFGGDHGGVFKNVQVVRLDKEFASEKSMISGKLKELGDVVEARIGKLGGGGVIIDLGDLKWLVEQPAGSGSLTGSTQVASEKGKIVVAEMAKLVARFSEGSGSGSGRLWLIGTATCETYLRCQVYHPTMESDWDLQAMPIAARAPLTGVFSRLGANGALKPSVGSLHPLKGLPIINPVPLQHLSENLDHSRKPSCCPECTQKLEQELAKLAAAEFESTCPEVKSETTRPTLPQWLQNAKINDGDAKLINNLQNKDQEGIRKQKAQELQKKWNETCLRSHPQFHQRYMGPERITPTPPAMTGQYNPNLLLKQPLQPKLNRSLGEALQLSSNPLLIQTPEQAAAGLPRSPVRTDLVLGQPKLADPTVEKPISETVKDFLGVLSSEPQIKVSEFSEKLLGKADADSYKKLLKGLADKVWWQHDAASAVASAITQCKLGNGKKRSSASKGDIWLLFTGPDRVGKKKMASALADLECGTSPIIISFGSRHDGEESNRSFRGKTALDRIAEAVRRNPFSVIMLEDIDEADMLVRGSIKKAIERGRIADSHGREISLGNVTIILSVNWLPDNIKFFSKSISLDEEKLESIASTAWQLRLFVCEKSIKRRANWSHEERFTKPRKDRGSGFGFDLNEAADAEDDRGDGSRNSSDLTVDSDIDHGIDKRRLSAMSLVYNEFVGLVDDSIVFNPVDFTPIAQDTKDSIVKAFSSIIGNRVSIEVQDEAVQKILGGVWLGDTGLEEWTESVLIPHFHQLRARLPSTMGMLPDESTVVRLESRGGDSGGQKDGNWLPSTVALEGL